VSKTVPRVRFAALAKAVYANKSEKAPLRPAAGEGWAHMPEKSGTDAALCVPPPAGPADGTTACPQAGVVAAAAAKVTITRKFRCLCMPNLLLWSVRNATGTVGANRFAGDIGSSFESARPAVGTDAAVQFTGHRHGLGARRHVSSHDGNERGRFEFYLGYRSERPVATSPPTPSAPLRVEREIASALYVAIGF
jgi:hypothetical protein